MLMRRQSSTVPRLLPRQPVVESFMADFEAAVWEALYKVFPGKQARGCNFHFSQAIWRRVRELGLQTTYNSKKKTHAFTWYKSVASTNCAF